MASIMANTVRQAILQARTTASKVSETSAQCMDHRLQGSLFHMVLPGRNMKFDGYDTLLTECMEQRAVKHGQRVHAQMIKVRYHPPVYLCNRLMGLYIACDQLRDARRVLDRMPERNVASWTAMISGYTHNGYISEAISLFLQMIKAGELPNEFTFAVIINAGTQARSISFSKQVHSHVVKRSFATYMFVASSLVDMYAKAGQIHEASAVFENLPNRDVVCWTTMIASCADLGHDEAALELFYQLQREVQPNYVTYTCVLTVISRNAAFDYGRQVHSKVIRSMLSIHVVLQNSLIDMYTKCGCLNYARSVFEHMAEKTVITWNAMLGGYAKHGHAQKVLELFELMTREQEVRPNYITFVGLLSSCSHGGLVEEGLKIFNSLVNATGVKPDIQHYECIVDLLGRTGQVEQAFQLVKEMPLQPTASSWHSLLSSCCMHVNVPIGEYAARRLFSIEPYNAANYVILSNIYSAVGRWQDALKVRALMEKKSVIKETGRSWVEFDKMMHTFHVGGSHSLLVETVSG